MNIKIGDYLIASDERQFVVKVVKKVTDKESENYGKDYMQNVAYCTSFDSALKFIPQQVLRSENDILVIKEKLDQIKKDIEALPKPIKIESLKVPDNKTMANIICKKLESVYCDSCNGERCEECCRKEIGWALSEYKALEIVNEICKSESEGENNE